jgi:hypothetical protein
MTTLVFQFASNGAAGWQFGDLGTAYVLQCPKHASELELVWQSG